MAYMVTQRFATAIREAYAGRPDVGEQRARAADVRRWAEGLAIGPRLRAELDEPLRAIEEAFADLERAPSAYARD